MFDTREIDPNKLMVSRQGLTFADLAKLNEGVILEPLASTDPINEISPFVAQGIAAYSSRAIKALIEPYTEPAGDEPGEEFHRLIARFKEIKASVPTTSLLKDYGYPTDATTQVIPAAQSEVSREEKYTEMIFGQGEPDFERVAGIIAYDPHNPDSLKFIEELFSSNGYDLTDVKNEQTAKDLSAVIAKTYRKQVFGNFRMPADEQELIELTCRWVESISDSSWNVGAGIRLGFVRSVLKNFDKNNSKPALMNELIERYIKSADVVISAEKNGIRKRLLSSRLREILENRISQYPATNILAEYGIFRQDGSVRPFNPIFASSFADISKEA